MKITLALLLVFLCVCVGRPSSQKSEDFSDQEPSDKLKSDDENEENSESNPEAKDPEDEMKDSDVDADETDKEASDEATTDEDSNEQEKDNSDTESNSSSSSVAAEEEAIPSQEQAKEPEADSEPTAVTNNADASPSVNDSSSSEKPAFYESVNAEVKPADVKPDSEAAMTVLKPSITQELPLVTETTDITTTNAPEVKPDSTLSGKDNTVTEASNTKLDETASREIKQTVYSSEKELETAQLSRNVSDLKPVETVDSLANKSPESENLDLNNNNNTRVDNNNNNNNDTESTINQPSKVEITQEATDPQEKENATTPTILTTTFDLPKLQELGHSDWFTDNKWPQDFDTETTENDEPVLDACSLIQENVFQLLGLNLTKNQIQNVLSTLNFTHESGSEDVTKLKQMLTVCSEAILKKQETEDVQCTDLKNRFLNVCNDLPECKGQETHLLPRAMSKLRMLVATDQLEDALLMIRVCTPHDETN